MRRLALLWSRFRGAVIVCAAVFAACALAGYLGSLRMLGALTVLLPGGARTVQSYVGELLMARLLLAALCGLVPAALAALYFAMRAARLRAGLFAALAALLSCCGAAFAYFLLLPPAITLLTGMGGGGFALNLTVMGYTSFCVAFVALCGALFNLPLAVRALSALGAIDAQKMRRGRKRALLLLLIAMAVLTPTQDAVTLLIAMAPLVLLYELSVLQLSLMEKRHG